MVDNPYQIDLNKALQKGMLQCVRKRDIVTARTLTAQEKKKLERGAPDVIVTTPSGQKLMKSRREIIAEYTYLDGKKISLAGWSSSKQYTIARLDDSQALAMMVPTNCTLTVGKKAANSANRKNGDYLVALVDDTGAIIEDSIGIIPSALFKKMYYMPQHDVIVKHKGSGSKYFNPSRQPVDNVPGYNGNANVRHVNTNGAFAPTKQVNQPANNFDFGADDMYNVPSAPVQNHGMNMGGFGNGASRQQAKAPAQNSMQQNRVPQQAAPQKSTPQKSDGYKYLVVGRLVDSVGETVGFIIQNKQGQTKDVTKGQLMGLCQQKVVSNVMLGIREDTGKPYLRGNNIRMDSIPTYEAQFNGQSQF